MRQAAQHLLHLVRARPGRRAAAGPAPSRANPAAAYANDRRHQQEDVAAEPALDVVEPLVGRRVGRQRSRLAAQPRSIRSIAARAGRGLTRPVAMRERALRSGTAPGRPGANARAGRACGSTRTPARSASRRSTAAARASITPNAASISRRPSGLRSSARDVDEDPLARPWQGPADRRAGRPAGTPDAVGDRRADQPEGGQAHRGDRPGQTLGEAQAHETRWPGGSSAASSGYRVVIGRAWVSQQLAVGVDRPLGVLRRAVVVLHPLPERGPAPSTWSSLRQAASARARSLPRVGAAAGRGCGSTSRLSPSRRSTIAPVAGRRRSGRG